MPVEQAILDFHPLEELTARAARRMLRGLLVAASRDMVDATLDAVQQAGLTPVDGRPDLVRRAALARPTPTTSAWAEAEALVDIGARVTNIVVHQGGVPRFVRILLMGGQDITDAVAERLGVPQEQAEALKQQLGIGAVGARRGRRRRPAAPSRHAAARSSTRSAARSTTTSPRSGSRAIARVVLTGGGSRLGGLVERLQAPPGCRSRSAARCTPADRQDRPHARAARVRRAAGRRAGRPRPGSGVMSTLTTVSTATLVAAARGSTCCRRRSSEARRFRKVQVGLGAGVVAAVGVVVGALYVAAAGQVGRRPGRARRGQGREHRAAGRDGASTPTSRPSTPQVDAARGAAQPGDGQGGPLVALLNDLSLITPGQRLARHA